MGEGWETARRRDPATTGWRSSLACEGVVTLAELDTSYFLGNAPGTASLTGIGPDGEVAAAAAHPAAARHPAPLRPRRAPRRRPGAAGRLPGRRHGPAPAVGAARPRPAGRRWAGAGSTRCPTSRRSRCSARSACRRSRPAASSAPARWAGPPARGGPPAGRPGGLSRPREGSACRPSVDMVAARHRIVRGAPGAPPPPPAARRPGPRRRAGRLRRRRRTADETAEKARRTRSRSRSGVRPDVSCPDDLEAEVGAETRCILTARATTRPSTASR